MSCWLGSDLMVCHSVDIILVVLTELILLAGWWVVVTTGQDRTTQKVLWNSKTLRLEMWNVSIFTRELMNNTQFSYSLFCHQLFSCNFFFIRERLSPSKGYVIRWLEIWNVYFILFAVVKTLKFSIIRLRMLCSIRGLLCFWRLTDIFFLFFF